MALSEKDIAILVQSTANVTAQLCKGDDTPVEEFFEIHEAVFAHSLKMITKHAAGTEQRPTNSPPAARPPASGPCPSQRPDCGPHLVVHAEKRSDRSPDWRCTGCNAVRWGKGPWKLPRG